MLGATTASATDEHDDDRVVHVRFGGTLLAKIDEAACASYRTRNGWVLVTLARAIVHGMPARGANDLDYLDLVGDRRVVTLRLPGALVEELDHRAARAGVTRTALITAIAARELGQARWTAANGWLTGP